MNLELNELRRPPGVAPYTWRAFEPTEDFPSFHWGDYDQFDNYWYVEVRRDTAQVARLELIDDSFRGRLDHYVGVPDIGVDGTRINLFEVAQALRGQGIGRSVITELVRLYPGRRFFAMSEADGFWAALGWGCHLHPTEPDLYQKLYIQPRRYLSRREA